MRIYNGLQEFEKLNHPIVTSGIFDGVHLGHQKILKRVKKLAEASNGETVLLTFWPHPKYVISPDKPLKLLNTFEEKAALMEEFGIDHLIKIPFTRQFSQISSAEFVKDILVGKIGTRKLVIGYDHRFGKNREGSFKYLQENASSYGFEVIEISPKDVDHIAVSSTKIREHILNHQIHLANVLLGRPYVLSGTVVKGQQIGRKIGFPTANIEIAESYKLVPSDGAYAVRIWLLGNKRSGMMNIGVKPTLGKQPRSIEVNIFDFEEEIYGAQLTVEVIKQIRPEMKFQDLEELTNRLKIDSQQALTILSGVN